MQPKNAVSANLDPNMTGGFGQETNFAFHSGFYILNTALIFGIQL